MTQHERATWYVEGLKRMLDELEFTAIELREIAEASQDDSLSPQQLSEARRISKAAAELWRQVKASEL